MLKDLCILFKNRFIDGDGKEFQFKNLDAKSAEVAERNAAEGITQFSQKLISNLKDGYHFIKPGGYYHRYLEFVDYELEATTQLANEWISLDAEDRAKTFQESTSVESMSEEFRQAEEYEEQIREDVGYWDEVEMDPGIVEDFPYINQPPVSNQPIGPSKTASRFHELWIKDGTLRFNFNHFCQGKWEGEVISIFMAKIPLSDRCWSAIYSANLSVSEVLDSLGALDDAPPF